MQEVGDDDQAAVGAIEAVRGVSPEEGIPEGREGGSVASCFEVDGQALYRVCVCVVCKVHES